MFHSHAFSFFVEVDAAVPIADLEKCLESDAISVSATSDEPPSPVRVAGNDGIQIGGMKRDTLNPRGVWFWAASDNLRIAAVNAVAAAERCRAAGSEGGLIYDLSSLHSISQDVSCMQYSAIRRMAKLAMQPDIIGFAAGTPSAETFPAEEIRGIAASILETDGKAALQYGLTLGYAGLIDLVSSFGRERRGINSTIEEICITSGSQQALDLDWPVVCGSGRCGVRRTAQLYRRHWRVSQPSS